MNNQTKACAMIVFGLLLSACSQGQAGKSSTNKPSGGLSPGFVANVAKGNELFDANCVVCHGVEAKGTKQGPPLVHKVYKSSHHSDLAFQWAVSKGSFQHHWDFGEMPPVKGVTPDQVGHITAYVRRLQQRAGIN